MLCRLHSGTWQASRGLQSVLGRLPRGLNHSLSQWCRGCQDALTRVQQWCPYSVGTDVVRRRFAARFGGKGCSCCRAPETLYVNVRNSNLGRAEPGSGGPRSAGPAGLPEVALLKKNKLKMAAGPVLSAKGAIAQCVACPKGCGHWVWSARAPEQTVRRTPRCPVFAREVESCARPFRIVLLLGVDNVSLCPVSYDVVG